ncbi:MAG: hypothetical protein NVS9B3_14230 [Gemmatimonadaceae bacterium]
MTLLSPLDGRVMFVLPAGDQTIIGTTETETRAHPDDVRASAADVAYLLASANAYFPGAALHAGDVIAAWAGIRPLAARQEGEGANAASREHAIVRGPGGMLTVSGGKLTTYRAMAQEIVALVLTALQRRAPRSATARLPLPGGGMDSLTGEIDRAALAVAGSAAAGSNTKAIAERLVHAYGSEWPRVWEWVAGDARLAVPLVAGLPYTGADVMHAVHAEQAWTLADILMRRTHVAYESTDHGVAVAERVASLVAPALGWDDRRRREEVARYAEDARRVFAIDAVE